MNTWAEIKKYIKDDNSFNPRSLYKPLWNEEKHEQEDEPESKNLLFESQLLSKSNISPINPEAVSSNYINITREIRWYQPNFDDYFSKIVHEKKIDKSVSTTYRKMPYYQAPEQTLITGSLPLLDPIIDDKKDYKTELIQILSNLNTEIEENNILIRKELTAWFEENGKDGINVLWGDLQEITSSEDKMSELLIALGRANDYNTIRERLELFEYFSSRESSATRYAVLLGLSNLDTYKILPIIYKMKKTEKIPVLKQIIESIIDKFTYVK